MTRTASSSPRLGIRMARTPNGESSGRSTAASRSRRCCTRTNTRAATTCASIRSTRTQCTRPSGSSNRRSGKAAASAAAATASSSPPMVAPPGSSSPRDCRRCCRRTSPSRRRIQTSCTQWLRRRRDPSGSTSRMTVATTGASQWPAPTERISALQTPARSPASVAAICPRSRSTRRIRASSTVPAR